MKRFLSLIALALVWQINAQVTYYNANQFPLLGKTSDDTETRYERLPAYLKEVIRSPVWNLGKNSASWPCASTATAPPSLPNGR